MKSLYGSDQSKEFQQQFSSPGILYRDAPFWAWNCELEENQLVRQIECFSLMGMGGFYMHARFGLRTPYLGCKFMECIKVCVAEAKKRNMLAWLYDEDRWPSGSAGGTVTQDPRWRARHLKLSFVPESGPAEESGKLLCCYAVKLDETGKLFHYERVAAQDPIPESYRKLYVYRQLATPEPWFNNMTYLDTLNPAAVRQFLEATHEKYFHTVGEEFHHTVPGIFTDEPQFTRQKDLPTAGTDQPAILPYTDDFPESYQREYGCDFFDTLPEIVWELPDSRYSAARYRFHNHVTERFATAYADQIGAWCREHNLLFTGHLTGEATLSNQSVFCGEVMRSYRAFSLPGIDMLCDRRELATAKQAQSASRQFGCGGVLSELDGVTNWDFSFADHKGHGDWQAALGVTLRVPHHAWLSMAGGAKRDFPASIGCQSAWYRKYHWIADHFARLNVALTRGKALVHIAVIHPIESFWLLQGPLDQTATARENAENDFSSLIEWLLFGLLDFDLLSESLLPEQNAHVEGCQLVVGEMHYSSILVPPTLTLRATTLELLEQFVEAGGNVIFSGSVAPLCDAERSARPARLSEQCTRISHTKHDILQVMEQERELRIIRKDTCLPATELLYQLREDGNARYLFVANSLRCGNSYHATVSVHGEWQLEELDTFTGTATFVAAEIRKGWTAFDFEFHPHGHLLLRLTPSHKSSGKSFPLSPLNQEKTEKNILMRLPGNCVKVSLDEPNVLLLDRAEWRVDGGPWEAPLEILRLDNTARAKIGLQHKFYGAQPWSKPQSDKIYGLLELRYSFDCRTNVSHVFLAAEQPESSTFCLDGETIPFADCGYWVDESIRRTLLPDLQAGRHTLCVKRKYTDQTNIEQLYLLGDFGVHTLADTAEITAPVRSLHWGDITTQGLPFYGGNISYHLDFELSKPEPLALRLPPRNMNMPHGLCNPQASRECAVASFRGMLVSVNIDGREAGDIAFSPCQLSLGRLSAGKHQLKLTLYGSRINCFGPLHLTFRYDWDSAPDAYRPTGDLFSNEYRLTPWGILHSPLLLRE